MGASIASLALAGCGGGSAGTGTAADTSDPSGRLSGSADGGKTWKQLTTVPGGQPQALTAVDAEHVLAATQTAVCESLDGGKTFTELTPLAS
ncbi:hypothetical protein [Streptomyces sp. NPDC000878]